MGRINIDIGIKKIVLETQDFTDDIDVDDLLTIHYENIPGEVVTIPVLLNRIGLLKAEAEGIAKKAKVAVKIHESGFKKKLRHEASVNGNYFKVSGERIKLSEKSLEEAVNLDQEFQDKTNEQIDAETNHEFVSVLYWSLSEKSKKLDNMIKGTTPEEFMQDIVDGVINGMQISKTEGVSVVDRRN